MKALVWVKDAAGTSRHVAESRKRWVKDLSETQYADLLDALRSLQEKDAQVKEIPLGGTRCIEVTFRHVTAGLLQLVDTAIGLVTTLSPQTV